MDLGQHHLYTCFCGAQFLYDLDINCTDNSPRDLWRELWRIREASKISYSQLFTTLLYSMYFPYTWTHASKKKSLPETCDPSGRLRFRKYSSHYARITCVALYRASGMLKNRSTENKTLMLNPHRACRDLRWEEKQILLLQIWAKVWVFLPRNCKRGWGQSVKTIWSEFSQSRRV